MPVHDDVMDTLPTLRHAFTILAAALLAVAIAFVGAAALLGVNQPDGRLPGEQRDAPRSMIEIQESMEEARQYAMDCEKVVDKPLRCIP